ncbi:MAG: carboxypeptidase regulatory-like domain-containing protein, partial [Candidatus Hydrogenedentes bacterium]|nr:carboxypeptidase regulatory-like domain-containing protein [Candidatus Hydrogenedentota bacterium]
INAQTLGTVEGAHITLTPGSLETDTSGFGTFLFTELGYANYSVQATAAGYETVTDTVLIDSLTPKNINLAMTPTQAVEGEPAVTGNIVGFILNSETQIPIANAQLLLTPGNVAGQSNTLGAFTFAAIDYGTYSLAVSADGYTPGAETVEISTPTVTTVQILLEDITPTGTIAGSVTQDDGSGAPIPDVTVTLEPGSISVETNTLGVYVFSEVAYGNYTIQFVLEGYTPASESVTVDASGVTTMNTLLSPLPDELVGTIAGIVIDAATDTPVEGAIVTLSPGTGQMETTAEGTFAFSDLAYGGYTITVSANGYDTNSTTTQMESFVVPLYISLIPTGSIVTSSINGLVIDAATALPIANAQVTVVPGDLQAQSNILGGFSFPEVSYGDYVVGVSATGYVSATKGITVEDATPATVPFSLQPIDVNEGEGEPAMTGSITGIVIDVTTNEPISNAQLTLLPANRQAQSTIFGTYLFDDVPYGDYIVEVNATGYISESKGVTVEDIASATAGFSLQPAGANEGEGEGEQMEGEQTEGEGEQVEGEETEGEQTEGEGEQVEGEEGEGEGEEEPTGCCRCKNNKGTVDWLFMLKEYWLLGIAMIGVTLFNKRSR